MTERPSHVRALRGSAWVFGGYAVGLVLALLVNALMAKVLVPTSLGVFFLTVSVVTFGSTVAQFGMETVAVRVIAHSLGREELGRARATIWRTLAVTLTGAALVGGTLAFGLWRWMAVQVFHSQEMARLHILAALMLAGVAVQNTMTSWFKGLQAMHLVAVFEGLLVNLSLCVSLLAIWLFHGGTTTTAIVAIRAAASGLVVIAMDCSSVPDSGA
jgi:O-antigen/teichoic acid export membrane protein